MYKEDIQRKEKIIIAIGFLTWGFSMLMRTAFGYFLDELSLSAAQAGIANAVLSGTVCVSALVVGSRAEQSGKLFSGLGVAMLFVAAGVVALAVAKSFPMIILSRVILGIGCGPLFPLLMKSLALASSDKTYPRNVGLVSNGEACISTIPGPVLLVCMLNYVGFRRTNFVFAILLVALGVCWIALSRSGDSKNLKANQARNTDWKGLLKNQRLMLCLAGGSLNLVASWCIFMYVPTLLQRESNLSDAFMSYTMTAMGIFMAVWMVVIPAWYSAGNKPFIIEIGCVISAIGPTLLIIAPDNIAAIVVFIITGGMASVMSLFFMAILSAECVESQESAAAFALINGGCELFGASLGPMVAGWLAEVTNIRASMMVSVVCMILSVGVVIKYKKLSVK